MNNINEKKRLLELLTQDGLNLKYIKNISSLDERYIVIALKSNPLSFKYLNDYYKDREDIIFHFIKDNPSIYKYTSNRFRYNKDLVLKAVNINGLVLKYVSSELENDYDVVLTAVNNNGYSIRYSSYNLKYNKDIILTALTNNIMSIRYIDKSIYCSDKDIILMALSNPISRYYITDISDELKDDYNFILKLLLINPKYISFASDKVKDIVRINYIREYTDTLLNNNISNNKNNNINKSLSTNNDIVQIDTKYNEFMNKEDKFINNLYKYLITNNISNDKVFNEFFNLINYEIELTINCITYPITDFDKLNDIFKLNIKDIYNYILDKYSIEYNLLKSSFYNRINYDVLPNDFYSNIVSIKTEIDTIKNKLLHKLISIKNNFLLSNNIYFEDNINKRIYELINIDINNYDIDRIVNSFNIYLNNLLDISNRINILWDKFYSIDKRLLSKNKYTTIRNNLSIDNLSNYLDNNSIDIFNLYIKSLEQEFDSLPLNSSKDIRINTNYLLNYIDYYCDNLLNILDLESDEYIRDNYLSKLHEDFNTYYNKYLDGTNENINRITTNNINTNYNSNKSKLLYLSFNKVIDKYRDKLKDIILDDNHSKVLIRLLQDKFNYLYSIYLDASIEKFDYDEAISIFEDSSLFDNKSNYIINDIEVSIQGNDRFGHIYYNVSNLEDDTNTCMYYDGENTFEVDSNRDLIPIDKFISNMNYVGKWDIGTLGLRHIIYKNDEYALAIQKDMFDNNYIMIIPTSELGKLMDYSKDIINEFSSYSNKSIFINDLCTNINESYSNMIKGVKKKVIYGD